MSNKRCNRCRTFMGETNKSIMRDRKGIAQARDEAANLKINDLIIPSGRRTVIPQTPNKFNQMIINFTKTNLTS
jgi:hypothetical protein